MKKTYFTPEMEVVELKLGNAILSGSTGAEGGDGDGGTPTEETNPDDPDWGSDY